MNRRVREREQAAADAPVKWLLGRGAAFSTASLARALATVVMLPLVTRVLAPDALGVVAIAAVVSSLLLSVGSLVLHSAANREYFGHDGGSADPRLGRALGVLAVVAVAAAGLVVHAAGDQWVRLLGDVGYDRALQLAVLTAVPMVLVVVTQNLLRAEDRALPFVVVALLSTVGGQILGLVLASAHDGDPVWYLTGVFSGYAVAGVGSAIVVKLRPGRVDRSQLKRALAIGLPTVPHSVGIFLLATGDRLVIERLEGVAEVGRYQVAYLVGSAGVVLVMAFNAAWAPLIFGADAEVRDRTLRDTTAAAQRLLSLVAAGLAVGAPLALAIAAPADYDTDNLVLVAALIAPAGLLYVRYQSAALALVASRRTGPLALATPLAAGFNLAANLVLVPVWGLEGAAIATTISYGVWALVIELAVPEPARGPSWWREILIVGAGLMAAVLMPMAGLWIVCRVIVLAAIGGRFAVELRHFVRS
ncbi:MAG: lipopolysaccharide biosynthesis protein [Acidimicrobiales bacterium]